MTFDWYESQRHLRLASNVFSTSQKHAVVIGVGRMFFRGDNTGFFQGVAKRIFWGGTNRGEVSNYQLENKKKRNIFLSKSEQENIKFQNSVGPRPPLPMPITVVLFPATFHFWHVFADSRYRDCCIELYPGICWTGDSLRYKFENCRRVSSPRCDWLLRYWLRNLHRPNHNGASSMGHGPEFIVQVTRSYLCFIVAKQWRLVKRILLRNPFRIRADDAYGEIYTL